MPLRNAVWVRHINRSRTVTYWVSSAYVGPGAVAAARASARLAAATGPFTSARDGVAERDPLRTVELHQAHLLDREEVLRPGLDLDTLVQQRQRQVEAGRLLH